MSYDDLLIRIATLRKNGDVSFFKLIDDLKHQGESGTALLVDVICATSIDVHQIDCGDYEPFRLEGDEMLLKAEALAVLAYINPSKAQEFIPAFLESSDSTYRWFACELLGRYPFPNAEELLLSHLRQEMDVDVRSSAVSSLGEVGSRLSMELLARIASEEDATCWSGDKISRLATDAIAAIHSRDR